MALTIKYQVRGVVLMAVLLASVQTSRAATVQLPKTGQTLCYDTAGAVIDCVGTGQDGEIQAGVAWPDPRFTDNGDGTVTDHVTGLIWLKDAGCVAVGVSWTNGLGAARDLHSGQCGLTDGSVAGDWRMPNTAEMESLIDISQADPALPAVSPFFDIQYGYWTSTTLPVATMNAEWIPLDTGMLLGKDKTQFGSVWPVRGVSTVLPKTGENACWDAGGVVVPCAGTGQDADKLNGVDWPAPRFIDNGLGTVADRLTGLVWLKNADCFGETATQLDALTSVKTLANGTCELLDGSVAGDWRLPNRKELRSLVNYSQTDGSAWLNGQGFVNATNGYYWSSDSYPKGVNLIWTPTADPNLGDKWMVRTIGGTGLSNYVKAMVPAEPQRVIAVRGRLTPQVTWTDPAAIGAGTALTATQLNATANVNGNFSYTPALGTVLSAGAGQTLSVTFSPLDEDNYAPVTKTVHLDVTPTTSGALLGDTTGDGQVDVADAQLALYFAIGAATPSAAELARGDVGPLVGGSPAADGKIDLSDALLILEKVVGLASW